MDIRRWFKSPKADSQQATLRESSSNDKKAKNESPKKATGSRKKRRIIESDSDEEPVPQQKQNKKRASEEHTPPEASKPKKSKSTKGGDSPKRAKPDPKPNKPISVAEFFGSAPVTRPEKKVLREKESIEKNHEDDDFCATLEQLDQAEMDVEEEVKPTPKKVSPAVKKADASDKPAAKIASKKKASKHHIEMEVNSTPKVPTVKEVTPEKPASKKSKGNASYASYLNREGPRSLGSKEIPEGEEDCLMGLTFVITGVLESIERDEAKSLIEKYGGKVMTTLTKNTKCIIIGRDAGASKLEKAEKFGTKQLDEDGLLELIRTTPGKGPRKKPKIAPPPENTKDHIAELNENGIKQSEATSSDVDSGFASSEQTQSSSQSQESITMEPMERPVSKQVVSAMWVDKYKPTCLKQVIGQQGDKSCAKKLLHWLTQWARNRRLNKKPIPAGRWNAQDDGSGFKAALLSGSPGVGKTTTAQLACKEAGFEYFELNASDTRSKKYLQQEVSQLLGNQKLTDCFKDAPGGSISEKHVIIMDEVDGMAGNEDRGGMQELIGFIKLSKVPIICICNDRNHQKIRSLSNYCFDLRFQKPRVEQIKAAMMSIAFKEKVKVTSEVLQDVIVATNQDIRQVLHSMSMWSAKDKNMTPSQTKSDVGYGIKHIKMSPFDVLREVFAIGNNPKATLTDKSALFFHDYSLAPLFVHENYVHVMPAASEGNRNKHLQLLSETANTISVGDLIDKQIRSNNNWGLLPTQAVFASVVPGELLRGHLRQMISFPAWLGKNSTRNHMNRVLQELHMHMKMKITGNKTDVGLDYVPLLKRALTQPMIEREQDGIRDALSTMEEYYLLREDFDSIIELALWPNKTDPRTKITPKVKTAFTKTYNKECNKNPYAVTSTKKKKSAPANAESPEGEDNELSEEEQDESLENDAMVKVKKPSKKSKASEEASTSKGAANKRAKKGTSKK